MTQKASRTESSEPKAGAVFSSARWSVGSSAVSQVVRLVYSLFLARVFLTPEDFGLMAMANVVMQFLQLFRDMGTGRALVTEKELTPQLLHTVFWLNIGVGVLLAALLAAASGLAATGFGDQRVQPLLAVTALGFVFTAFGSVPSGVLQHRLAFNRVAVAEGVSLVLYIAVGTGMALQGYGVWALVGSALVGQLANSLASFGLARYRPALVFSREELRRIFAFSANLTLFNIVNYGLLNADKVLIGRLLGAADLGLYSWADRLLRMPMSAIVPQLFRVLFPALARSDSDSRVREGVLRAVAGLALVLFPITAGIGAVGDSFVRVALDETWAPIGKLLPLLCVRYLGELTLRIGTVLYSVRKRTDLQLYWGIGSGIVFLLSYLVGARWGLMGVAAAQACAMLVLFFPGLSLPLRLIRLPVATVLKHLAPYALATVALVLLAAGSIYATRAAELWEPLVLGIGVAAGAVGYITLLSLQRPPGLRDLAQLLGRKRKA